MASLLTSSVPSTSSGALQAALTAVLANIPFTITPTLNEVATSKLVADASVALQVAKSTSVLFAPPAISRYIASLPNAAADLFAEKSDAKQTLAIAQWVDWSEATLSPRVNEHLRSGATTIDEKSPLYASLSVVDAELSKTRSSWLARASVSAADIAVYAAAYPVLYAVADRLKSFTALAARVAALPNVKDTFAQSFVEAKKFSAPVTITIAAPVAVAATKAAVSSSASTATPTAVVNGKAGKGKDKTAVAAAAAPVVTAAATPAAAETKDTKKGKGKPVAAAAAASSSSSSPSPVVSASVTTARIANGVEPKVKLAPFNDFAWRPTTPLGHSTYSWGRPRQAQSVNTAAAATATTGGKAVKPAKGTTAAAAAPVVGADGVVKKEKKTTKKDRAEAETKGLLKKVEATALQRLSAERKTTKPSGAPKLPVVGKRNILITSALPYVNNVPHLGNIIGCVLSADVYARFTRQRGHNVVYICGTDEYGTATEQKALKEKLTPQAICDKYHAIHRQVYEWFNISFDQFGRTTTPDQTRIAQDIFKKIDANNFLVKENVDQLLCLKCDRYLADRFVFGTCPKPGCGYDDARGDQCDKCGELLNPIDLINPRCSECQSRPERRVSPHLHLDLPRLSPELKTWFERASEKGKWSPNAIAVTNSWFKVGLEKRCISRDLKWGTPVPKEGYTNKVFYVWFDAPIGYVSITSTYCGADNWEKWWKNPENVELVQFMGKDNVPFHCVVFPASLIGTREPYTLLHKISTTEYLQYCGGKFSKSRGTGVFGDGVQQTRIPADVWRYYLLVNRPESADTTFEWVDFAAKNNTELLNNLGNFLLRSLLFCRDKLDRTVGAAGTFTDIDTKFVSEVTALTREYITLMEGTHIKDALRNVMAISRAGNLYWQETQPWVSLKNGDTVRTNTVLSIVINTAYLLAHLVEPFMPTVSEAIQEQVGRPLLPTLLVDNELAFSTQWIAAGHKIGNPEPLFTQVDEKEVEELRAQFGGQASMASQPFPLDLRTATITDVKEHPDATASQLFIVTVDVGATDQAPAPVAAPSTSAAAAPAAAKKGKGGAAAAGVAKKEEKEEKKEWLASRQIVTALRGHYTREQLIGRQVVVAINTKAAQIKKVPSQGIILLGCQPKPEVSGVCSPVTNVANGTLVRPQGAKIELSKAFDLLKHFQALNLVTRDGNHAFYGDLPLATEGGVAIVAEKVVPGAFLKF